MNVEFKKKSHILESIARKLNNCNQHQLLCFKNYFLKSSLTMFFNDLRTIRASYIETHFYAHEINTRCNRNKIDCIEIHRVMFYVYYSVVT